MTEDADGSLVLICLIVPLVFFGTFRFVCFGVVGRCTDFGLERWSNSIEGIGINASLLICGDRFEDVPDVTDVSDVLQVHELSGSHPDVPHTGNTSARPSTNGITPLTDHKHKCA